MASSEAAEEQVESGGAFAFRNRGGGTDAEGVELTNLDVASSPNFDDGEDLPPLSDYISKTRFWWHVAKWPLLVIVVNIIAIIGLIDFDFGYDYYEPNNSEWGFKRQRRAQSIVFRNFVVASILLLLDAALLFRGGRHTEVQVEALENERDTAVSFSTTNSVVNVHAKASKVMDAFFCRGQCQNLPKVTFLVNLAFALSVVIFSVGVSALANTLFLAIPTTDTANVCFGGMSSTNETKNFPDSLKAIPDSLQEWAVGGSASVWNDDLQLADSATVAAMGDGTIFFSATSSSNPGRPALYHSHDWGQRILMEASPNRTLIAHHDVMNPENFVNVSGSIEDNCQEICLTYTPVDGKDEHYDSDFLEFNRNVLCYRTNNHVMRNVTWRQHSKPRRFYFSSYSRSEDVLLGSEGSNKVLWLRTNQYSHHAFGSQDTVLVHKLDLNSMNMTPMGSMSRGDGWERQLEKCASHFAWIDLAITGAAAVGGSVWLLKMKAIPSGMLPACAYALALVYYLDVDFGFVIGILSSLGATMGLMGSPLPKWLSREMLIWGLYTDIAVMTFVSLSDFDYDRGETYLVVVVMTLIITGVVLNHPLLQLCGWIGAIVTVVMIVAAFFDPYDEELISGIPVAILISCGLGSAGYYLSKYRLYVIVYSRRLWRALEATGRSNSRRHRERGAPSSTAQMRRGLLDDQEERP